MFYTSVVENLTCELFGRKRPMQIHLLPIDIRSNIADDQTEIQMVASPLPPQIPLFLTVTITFPIEIPYVVGRYLSHWGIL